MMVNAEDFGAAGNGLPRETAAVQKAPDTGENVHFHAGSYLCGTLYLRSGGGIHLDRDAVIPGSVDKEDHSADDFSPHNFVFSQEKTSGAHLLIAENAAGLANVVFKP